jgi:gibberellin 3-beta-dioxygenase
MEAKGDFKPQHLSDLIPVIDLAALQDSHVDDSKRKHIITDIANACKNWGAFQLVNHGVHLDVIDKARDQARQLFELPSETRWKAKRQPGSLSGYGNGAVIGEAVNNRIASKAITFGYPQSEAAAIASKLWPQGNPDFG